MRPEPPPFYENLAFWMYVLAWLPYVLFVAFYGLRSPWWRKNPTGRALMASAGSIVAVLSFVLIVLVWPDMPAQVKDVLRTALMGGVTVGGWLLFKELRRLQRQRHSDHPLRRSTD